MKGILWVTIVAVGVSFILWGTKSRVRESRTPQFVGEIYGRNISFNEYRKSFDWLRRMAMMRYGRQFDQIVKFLNLEEEAWENIILLRHAELKGIRVSDDELASVISSLPVFQREGKFDSETYRTVLRYDLGVRPEYFEDGMRTEVSISRLRNSITDCIKLTEQELRQYYRFANEEVRVKYIPFKSSDFEKAMSVTEEQVRDYFESNREEFRKPEKVKLQYVVFKVEVEDTEIKDYYSRNKEKYKKNGDKKKIRPLSEVRDEIREYLKNRKALKAKEEAGELLFLLEDGEKSWDELEVEETDFLGIGSTGSIPSACIDAVFPMEIDDNELVRTPGGFYIVKLVDRKESSLPEDLDEVAAKVEEKIRKIESSKLAHSKAEGCLRKLEEKKDIAAIARQYSIEVMDTDFFTRSGYIKELGVVPRFRHVAFSLNADSPFGMAEIPSGFCVLEFGERKKIDEEKFNEEKDKLARILLGDKRGRIFSDWFWLLKEKAGFSITYTLLPQNDKS